MSKWQYLFQVLIIYSFSGFYLLNNNIALAQSIDKDEDQNSAVFFRANASRTGYFDENGPANDKVKKLWSFKTENSRIEASPVVYDSMLYLGSSGDHLYAIDISTGTEQWRSDSTGFFRSSAAIDGNHLFIGNTDQHLYAFNLDGSMKWTFETEGVVFAAPLVIENHVFFGSIDTDGYSRYAYKTDSVQTKSKFYALDAQTGKNVWHFSPGGGLRSSPAYHNGVLYFGSWDGNLYALNASNGELIWSFKTEGKIYTTPAIENNSVIFASNDEFLYSLNVEDGIENWRFHLQSDEITEFVPRISSPAVSKNTVYIGSLNGNLYAVDLEDGSLKWSFETDGKIGSSPSVTDNLVYFGSDDSYIYALQTSDGGLIWKYKSNSPIGTSSPFIQDGKLYIGTMGHEIIALE
jgi:outer membrane protein assembly factor BamB